jgi:ketosteroid isomerase-like protein
MGQTSAETRSRSNGTAGQARDADVHQYLRDYAKALTAGDGKTIATMWEVPALLMSDGGVKAVTSREEIAQFFSGAKDEYNARDIKEAIPQVQTVEWATDRLVTTRVRWPYINSGGQEIGEESSTYTLRRDDNGALKLCAVVMHGEKKR